MIKQETVLVLGAGASMPFGFPSGWQLVARLCHHVLTAEVGILDQLGFQRAHIEDFRVALLRSGCTSVDLFLEDREDFMDVGKAAIAIALLPAEQTTSLFDKLSETCWAKQQGMVAEDKQDSNWYQSLWSILTEECTFDAFDKNNLSIVTFNYDRSLEHYLFTAMKNKYNKTDEECAKKLKETLIVHVYGSLGLLPWQVDDNSSTASVVPYDPKVEPGLVKQAADSIQIMRESDTDSPLFQKARKMITRVHGLYFLRLGPNLLKKKEKKMGTVFGLRYARARELRQHGIVAADSAANFRASKVYEFLHDNVDFNEL
jgi:hypothetical protein